MGDNVEGEVGGRQMRHFEELCSYLSKFIIMDYNFLIESSTLLLAESLAKAVLEIACILPPTNYFTSSPILIELTKQRILKNVRHHSSSFSGLNNVFKFTQGETIAQVEKYIMD
jgi:hypothetical protein